MLGVDVPGERRAQPIDQFVSAERVGDVRGHAVEAVLAGRAGGGRVAQRQRQHFQFLPLGHIDAHAAHLGDRLGGIVCVAGIGQQVGGVLGLDLCLTVDDRLGQGGLCDVAIGPCVRIGDLPAAVLVKPVKVLIE